MINPGIIVLAQIKHANYRFDIKDNIGESIHIHYQDMRLDFTIREFLEFSEKVAALVDVLISDKNISREEYDPVFFADLAPLIPYLEKITQEELRLEDLLIDTLDEHGNAVVSPLTESRVLKALSGNTAENDSEEQINYFSSKSRYSSNGERLSFNLDQIRKADDLSPGDFITVFNDSNLIRYGQHRAACLYFLKGNLAVPVRRLWLAKPALGQEGPSAALPPVGPPINRLLLRCFKRNPRILELISQLLGLKARINGRGLALKNPLHWGRLALLGLAFILCKISRRFSTFYERAHEIQKCAPQTETSKMENPTGDEPERTKIQNLKNQRQTHAQIWARLKPTHAELAKMRRAIPNFKKQYMFSIIIPGKDGLAVSSAEKQIYGKFEIILGGFEKLAQASGDYVLFLQPNDYLHKNTLFELNYELNRLDESPPLVYFDHDYSVNGIPDNPCYKPGWSPDLLSTNDYIGRACLFRRNLLEPAEFRGLPPGKELYTMALKLAGFGAGHHKPGILLTMPYSPDEPEGPDEPTDNPKPEVYSNPYLKFDETGVWEDPNPTLCRQVGSPTLSPAGLNKIIIVKLDHIGDVVLSIPALRKIRQLLPDAQIDILCGPWAKELLERLPEIDKVFTHEFFNVQSGLGYLEEKENREAMIRRLQQEKYDLAVNLRKFPDTRELTPHLADFSLVFSDDSASETISHPLPGIWRRRGDIVKWSIKDQLLSLANALEFDETLNGEVSVSPGTRDKVEALLGGNPFFQSDFIIGIHVGSGDSNRKWPLEHFADLCLLIHETTPANILLLGSAEEELDNQTIIGAVKEKDRIRSVAGIFSLIEFFHLVKNCDYFIGNNSGPAHIAGLQGVSTLVIFGSRHPSPEWAPVGNSLVVERRAPCGPCYDYDGCPGNDCLTGITPRDVLTGLERLMILYPSKRKSWEKPHG